MAATIGCSSSLRRKGFPLKDNLVGYDIVGDVHGHADELEALLRKLDYRDTGGSYRHPDRHLVFVGDLIDRGPSQMRVVEIARRMQDAGQATVVMGNHEFNAIGWMTERPDRPGSFLRDRAKSDNIKQHAAFLSQVGDGSARHHELIAWMKTLPLWIEFPGFRVVHACWHEESMAALAPYLASGNQMMEESFHTLFEHGSRAYEAAEIVLKGLEAKLPDGKSFLDKDENPRKAVRVRWWDDTASTLRSAALGDDSFKASLPDDPLPLSGRVSYDGTKPVFFGHYWLNEDVPKLVSHNRACLDYSVARCGHLVAYRWDGETVLEPDKFVSVRSGVHSR